MVNAYGASEVKTWLMGVLFSILLLPASVYAQTQGRLRAPSSMKWENLLLELLSKLPMLLLE